MAHGSKSVPSRSSHVLFSQDIINRQIEAHANYSLKTEYSKEKYKKRKEEKWALR